MRFASLIRDSSESPLHFDAAKEQLTIGWLSSMDLLVMCQTINYSEATRDSLIGSPTHPWYQPQSLLMNPCYPTAIVWWLGVKPKTSFSANIHE